ncbi:MAG: CDP-diacylglycerol--glycerol-3-phosphate 3-phosphatidyltransferase [Candidatus Goldbacteria bacterium]|nr:CDP-diacylglycerol--glycerol-3-phosphate 3-phosphatidyltransferase [Candidatus Goldiibacteriota bacterium]
MKFENLKKIPNRLTMFRIFIIIIFIPTVLMDKMISSYIALFLFIIAAISDYLDGYIARKYNIISNFGKVMDPLADKIMVISALLCFIQLNVVPAWMVIIIIAREFLISGIRIMAAKNGDIIAASNWGKAKTITEIIAIIAILVLLAIVNTLEYLSISTEKISILDFQIRFVLLKLIPYWLMFVVAVTALISGLEYYFKNSKIFENEI